MMSMLIMLSYLAFTTQGKFIMFIVTLVVTGNTRAAKLGKGICSDGFFSCENGDCIGRYDVCDGTPHCSDGSDEMHPICMENSCLANTFRCAYGACIAESAKCDDGKNDCADGSDELSLSPSCKLQWLDNISPPCRKHQFQCRNGECISSFSLCDGKVDCSDKSDESIPVCYGGRIARCPLHSFRCAYGGCISSTDKCDFKNDCADGSDEHYLLCNRPKNQTITPSKPPGRQCIVPGYDHTYFSRLGCKEGECVLRKGGLVDHGEVFQLNCHSPYLQPNDIVFVHCSNGVWIPEKHTCLKVCKPLISTSLNITCEHKYRTVNCANEVPADTKVQLRCKGGHDETEILTSFNECLESGDWLYLGEQHCYYRCGILNKPKQQSVKPLIDDGEDSLAAYHPWNVGLYLFDRPSSSYHLFCGGTLISPFTVLSAAHCFVKEETAEHLDKNDVWSTLGKTKRDWNLVEDREQKIQVENYYIPDKYAARNLSFLYDIAVVELKTQAEISKNFGMPIPACLANPKTKLTRGSIGQLAGWGKNHGYDSEILQAANLTYQPYEYCREHANNTILDDHFCAYNNEANGSISQPTVNSGDSGSGFIMEIKGNHFIYGVTSTRQPTKHGFVLSTFTDVTHVNICNFIRKKLKMINDKHNNFPFHEFPCK